MSNEGTSFDYDLAKPFLAMAALVRGFSWSVSLAQMNVEGIIREEIKGLEEERTLVHGVSIPIVSPEETAAKPSYIDGAAVVGMEDVPPSSSPSPSPG